MAKDIFHKTVRTALEKDGWLITNDPYKLKVLETNYDIDLGAEKLLAAEKGNQKIAVEIKSFIKLSFAHEFHGALGQYLNYASYNYKNLQESCI
jgi:XisH protein